MFSFVYIFLSASLKDIKLERKPNTPLSFLQAEITFTHCLLEYTMSRFQQLRMRKLISPLPLTER